MNLAIIRLRYIQFFVIGLLTVFLYTMSQSLYSGPSDFESNLWGREFLTTSFTRVRLKLGDQVFSQALVGQEGWLEYTGARNIDGYQNAIQTSPGTLENSQQKLQQLYDALRKRNITLILVIAPDKATIYPDKVPNKIEKLNSQSLLDKFALYIKQHGPPVFVDLRAALQEGRKKWDVYYKTDTHWNPYGGFFAYREIMKEISKSHPQLAPNSLKDFKLTIVTPSYLYGTAKIMGAAHIREDQLSLKLKKNTLKWATYNDDTIIPLTISTSSQKHSLKLLMYMDSFGRELRSFLAPHFSKATFIQNTSKYPDAISLQLIDTIKPDIIIVEIVERHFNAQILDIFLKNILLEEKLNQ